MATNDIVCKILYSVNDLESKFDKLIEIEKEKNELLLKIRNSLANVASIQAMKDLHPYIDVKKEVAQIQKELTRIADSMEKMADAQKKYHNSTPNLVEKECPYNPNVKYYTPEVYVVPCNDPPEEKWWDNYDTSSLSWFFS